MVMDEGTHNPPGSGRKHRHRWNLHYRPCRDFISCSEHPRLCERCGYQQANHPPASGETPAPNNSTKGNQ